jgi:ABC-type nitrate/sulfonate/bicarbonate transport system substrate-binding protein
MPFAETWAASTAYTDKNPKVIPAFLDAVYKAVKHMRDDKEFAIKFLKKHLETDNDKLVELAYEIVIKTITTDGKISRKAIEGAIDEAKRIGVSNLPTVDALVVTTTLK